MNIKQKPIKINKDLRDLLLSHPSTEVINQEMCRFRGKIYSYPSVTYKKILKKIIKTRKLLKEL